MRCYHLTVPWNGDEHAPLTFTVPATWRPDDDGSSSNVIRSENCHSSSSSSSTPGSVGVGISGVLGRVRNIEAVASVLMLDLDFISERLRIACLRLALF